MRPWLGPVAAALALSACASQPPVFWKSACANETAEIRHETPAPDGLALLNTVEAFDALVITGATWVEFNENRPYGPMPNGPGHYRLNLTRLAEPECREALRLRGYDPATRTWLPNARPASNSTDALHACADIEFLGSVVLPPIYRGILAPTLKDTLVGWTAPYAFTLAAGLDPRSTPDARVDRHVALVVHRESGKPVLERPAFLSCRWALSAPGSCTAGRRGS